MNRPHHLDPAKSTVRVVHAVKNFAAIKGVCHIGLGVTATNCVKTLRAQGVFAEAWATQTADELKQKLKDAEAQSQATGLLRVSHVIVSAPSWVQPNDFKSLCLDYPNIEFVLLNHSGCAFLSIDKFGIKNNRECIDLQLTVHNFRVAANNTRVSKWLSRAFNFNCLYLPNLYDVTEFIDPYPMHRDIGGTLRLGSFGASRPWKNQLTAAEAAVQLAREMGVNLELYVNSRRPDGGERMIESRNELFAGLRGCSIVEVPWESWPRFRTTVGNMHLLLQPSFDETFNVVTADGISAGVASITSESIEWTPQSWWASTCDPDDLVRVGLYLLNDKYAVEDARDCLRDYVKLGTIRWKDYLYGGD